MKIYGLAETSVREALRVANLEFEGNLRFNREPELISKRNSGYACTIRVHDSIGPGAKSGFSGRRTISANYFAHYAFMLAIFEQNPDARILTAMETYNGFLEFKDKAPEVAYRNVGSQTYPQYYGSM